MRTTINKSGYAINYDQDILFYENPLKADVFSQMALALEVDRKMAFVFLTSKAIMEKIIWEDMTKTEVLVLMASHRMDRFTFLPVREGAEPFAEYYGNSTTMPSEELHTHSPRDAAPDNHRHENPLTVDQAWTPYGQIDVDVLSDFMPINTRPIFSVPPPQGAYSAIDEIPPMSPAMNPPSQPNTSYRARAAASQARDAARSFYQASAMGQPISDALETEDRPLNRMMMSALANMVANIADRMVPDLPDRTDTPDGSDLQSIIFGEPVLEGSRTTRAMDREFEKVYAWLRYSGGDSNNIDLMMASQKQVELLYSLDLVHHSVAFSHESTEYRLKEKYWQMYVWGIVMAYCPDDEDEIEWRRLVAEKIYGIRYAIAGTWMGIVRDSVSISHRDTCDEINRSHAAAVNSRVMREINTGPEITADINRTPSYYIRQDIRASVTESLARLSVLCDWANDGADIILESDEYMEATARLNGLYVAEYTAIKAWTILYKIATICVAQAPRMAPTLRTSERLALKVIASDLQQKATKWRIKIMQAAVQRNSSPVNPVV